MISGSASFVPVTQKFLDHWAEVNLFLGSAGPLVLENGETIAQFEAARDALLQKRDLVEEAALDRAEARVLLENNRAALLKFHRQFNDKVRANISKSHFARLLADVPGAGVSASLFRKPMKLTEKLWEKINAAPPPGLGGPLTVMAGSLAQFTALLNQLQPLTDEVTSAEGNVSLELEERNDLQDALRPLMVNYRLQVPTVVPAGHALLDTLPTYSGESSRTPEAVPLQGAYNAATQNADLQAGQSADPDLEETEFRYCAGPDYETELESVVGSVPAGEPPIISTNKGLLTPGSTASYRAYVRLTSGGERGSNTVVITRPA